MPTNNSHSGAPWAGIPATGPILRPKDAAEYLGYGRSQFYALVGKGELPQLIKLGSGAGGASGVPKPWLDAVIAARAAEGAQA